MPTTPTMATTHVVRPVVDAPVKPLGYQQITSLSSSTALTVPTLAVLALIQAEDQNVRYRDDTTINSTAPTTTVGVVLHAGDSIWYNGVLSELRFIEETASAKLNVLYYGYKG